MGSISALEDEKEIYRSLTAFEIELDGQMLCYHGYVANGRKITIKSAKLLRSETPKGA